MDRRAQFDRYVDLLRRIVSARGEDPRSFSSYGLTETQESWVVSSAPRVKEVPEPCHPEDEEARLSFEAFVFAASIAATVEQQTSRGPQLQMPEGASLLPPPLSLEDANRVKDSSNTITGRVVALAPLLSGTARSKTKPGRNNVRTEES